MQRVHQMILSEVGDGGLERARASLKRTPTTTVLQRDGRRSVITRSEDGSVREELLEAARPEDEAFLDRIEVQSTESDAGVSGSQITGSEHNLRVSCDEDLLDTSECGRFSLDDLDFMQHLQDHGYVVLKDIVSADERATAEGLLWQFLEKNAEFVRGDPSSWTDHNFDRIGCVSNGIISRAGIGHSDFMWYLRLRPRVRKAFEAIWDTSSLLSSFDGANIFRPWRNEGLGISKTHGGWYHVDQGKGLLGLQSVQGFVSLLDADASTGGFVVIPKSHKRHEELVEYQHSTSSNYISVPAFHPIMEMTKKLVVCKAGDLVLWDSRCVHCNAPGCVMARKPLSNPGDPDLLRIAAYMCMTPKAKASAEVLRQRKDAYERSVITSHWPHLYIPSRGGRDDSQDAAPTLRFEDAGERAALIA